MPSVMACKVTSTQNHLSVLLRYLTYDSTNSDKTVTKLMVLVIINIIQIVHLSQLIVGNVYTYEKDAMLKGQVGVS